MVGIGWFKGVYNKAGTIWMMFLGFFALFSIYFMASFVADIIMPNSMTETDKQISIVVAGIILAAIVYTCVYMNGRSFRKLKSMAYKPSW